MDARAFAPGNDAVRLGTDFHYANSSLLVLKPVDLLSGQLAAPNSVPNPVLLLVLALVDARCVAGECWRRGGEHE
jgi:hypothetical protein